MQGLGHRRAGSQLVERKLVLMAGFAPALPTLSRSCPFIGLREQKKWSLQPVLTRQNCFTKAIRRLRHGGGNDRLRGSREAKASRNVQCCPGRRGLMKPA